MAERTSARERSLQSRARGVIDAFLPHAADSSDDETFRSRIFVAVNLCFLVAVASVYLIVEFALDMPGMDPALTHKILGSVSVGLIAALAIFRLNGSLRIAGWLMVASIYATLVGAIALQGGFAHSPSRSVFLVLPVVVGLFAGRWAGLVWGGIVLATWWGFYHAERVGVVFPGHLPPESLNANVLLNLAASTVGITAVVTIYQTLNLRLRRALAQEREMLVHLAGHDPLTNVPNRRNFSSLLRRAVGRADRGGKLLAVLAIDLDDFKPINDRFGHAAGDEVLVGVAERLCEVTRVGDTVARLGGDEFAMLVEMLDSRNGVEGLLEKLGTTLRRPHWIEGHEVRVEPSIGVSVFPDDGREGEVLHKLADAAMYRAKAEGNLYCFAHSVEP